VLDVSGREVAKLHRGAATAGAHTFRWEGRRDGGDRLPDGIYFIRARGLDVTLARKVILLRDR
jgi:flagellar hook assembly protein FlgD